MDKAALDKKLEILDSLLPAKDDFFAKRAMKALVIDLSNESSYDWEIPQRLVDSYVSGPALAARLWAAFVGPEVDSPSSYETSNPVVFTASVLSNMHVPGGETVGLAFRSPVTKSLAVNYSTNTIGMRLDSLGYVALIIIGRLRRPTIVEIRKTGVTFSTSESFIGYTVSQIESMLGSKPMTTILSIGPAGEQKVPFSTVVCEGSALCRGGLGVVFGFKNIKAIRITGISADAKATEDAEREAISKKIEETCSGSRHCAKMKSNGTSCLISSANYFGWAPVSNFRRRSDPRLFHFSGSEISRRFGDAHGGCINCPIHCKHLSPEGYVIPDFQSLLMLGSNVECFDVNKIMVRQALCLDMGLDPISTGNVLGWALQASEEGLFAGLDKNFSFSNNDQVLPLIEMIAKRVGAGEPLSFGVKALGEAFEDSSFAYEIRGLECGPYDYRGAFSQCLTDIMGLGITNQFEIVSRLAVKDSAYWAVFSESLSLGLASFGLLPSMIVPLMVDGQKFPVFVTKIIPNSAIKMLKPKLFSELLTASLKVHVLEEDILSLGDLCWFLIYEINKECGFDMLEDCFNLLPTHFSVDPESNCQESAVVPVFDLLQRYCLLRKKGIAYKFSKLNGEKA